MINKYALTGTTILFIIYYLYYFISNINIIVESKQDHILCHDTTLWIYNISSLVCCSLDPTKTK